MPQEPEVLLRDLYPNLSDRELEDAAANLRRYLAVLLRMTNRLHFKGETIHNVGLTNPENSCTIPAKRSSQTAREQCH